MDAIREKITLTSKTFEKCIKCGVETGVIVPDKKPDVLRILQADAVSAVRKYSATEGKLLIEGTVCVTVIYLPENSEEKIKSISTSIPFNEVVTSNEINDEAHYSVNSEISEVNIQLVNSRKLNINCIVELKVDVNSEKTFTFVSTVECEKAACRYTRADIDCMKECRTSDFLIKDSIEVRNGAPQISEILKCDLRIEDKEAKAVTNKVVFEGTVAANVLYISTAGTVEQCEASLPFTDVIEFDESCEDNDINVGCDIIESNIKAEFNADGEKRNIIFELLVSAEASTYRQESIQYLSDCYYFGYETKVNREFITNRQTRRCPRVTKNVRECIAFDSRMPAPSSVYNVVINPVVKEIECNKEMAEINTELEVCILYLSENENNPICCMKHKIPLTYMHKKAGDCELYANVECEHISYSINMNGELELRAVIGYSVEETSEVKLEIVCDVEKGVKGGNSEFVIMYATGEEDLWDIGKKYRVSCDEIAQINHVEPNQKPIKGQRLLIPCL